MKGFKGFNKQLQCTPNGKVFQYEVGKTYTEPTATICNRGFHFCENPLDVFSYYGPAQSRYTEVEADDVRKATKEDSKRVSKSITIGAEIDLRSLIGAGLKFIFNKVEKPTTGYYAHSATTGDSAHSATTGNSAESSVKGKNAIAASLGVKGKAKAEKGGWLVLAEYKDNGDIKAMGIARVNGKKIRADTFYSLKDGKFVECEK